MNSRVIPIAPAAAVRQRKREAPKGRRASPEALATVRQLLGDAPRRRDLLIEYLHLLQDRFGHLSADHLTALAQETQLAQTEKEFTPCTRVAPFPKPAVANAHPLAARAASPSSRC